MNRAQKLLQIGRTESPWRLDFPMLMKEMNGKPLTFLDSGASAQKPYAVINAMMDVIEDGYSNIHRGLYKISSDLTTKFEESRAKIARFIGAPSPENIIFTKNATESLNLVAQSWGRANLNAGDEIILTVMEHHANIVPWQLVAQERGALIRVAPMDANGHLDISALLALLSPRTRVLALTHVSNVLGTINPVADIINRVKAFAPDILTVVDGSQGVVHGPVDVHHMNCDFYAFTGHKLYGPTGVGVLYGKMAVMEKMPPWQGGGDMIEQVSFSGTTFRAPPHRFESGTPAIAEVIGLGAAVDYISNAGWDKICAHEDMIAGEMMAALKDIEGLTLYGPHDNRAGIFSFTVDWAHTSDVAMILDQCGVAVRTGHHCAMPLRDALGVAGTVRASIGMYTNSADVVAFAAAMKKAREMLS